MPKYCNPKMKKALEEKINRDPLLFAPDQYEPYVPSWIAEELTLSSKSNRRPRFVGKGLYEHEFSEEERKANIRRKPRKPDEVEELIARHEREQD